MDPFNEIIIDKLSDTDRLIYDLKPLFEDEFKEAGYNFAEILRIYQLLETLIDDEFQLEGITNLLDLKSDIITFMAFFDQFGVKFIIDFVMHDTSDGITKIREQIYHETMTSVSRSIVGRERKKGDRIEGIRGGKKEREITNEIDVVGRQQTAKAVVAREIAISRALYNKTNIALKKILKEFKAPQFEISPYSKAVLNYFESLYSQWESAQDEAKQLIAARINRDMGLVYFFLPLYKDGNILEKFKPVEKVVPTPKLIEETVIVEPPIEITSLSIGGSELVLEVDSIVEFLARNLSLDAEILKRISKAGKEITIIIKALLNTPSERLNQKIYELLKNYKRFGQVAGDAGIIYILHDKANRPICKIFFIVNGDRQLQIQFYTNELKEIPVEIVEA